MRTETECKMLAGCQKGISLSRWRPMIMSKYNRSMNITKPIITEKNNKELVVNYKQYNLDH